MALKPSTRKWFAAVVGLVLWFLASRQVGALNEQRAAHNLVLPPLPKTVSPSALLTPIFSLGRAPLVDYLWLRATRLKDEGRFFDAYQLAQLICELQPNFASVWAFQGWNMAYNISVTLKTPEERWRWVRNGYELIRDKGIPLNPNNTQLYRELAWILFHKVGDVLDEWHGYYKLQFALMMEDVLGPVPDGYVRPGVVAGDYYRNYDYKRLAEAPHAAVEVRQKPGVAELIEGLAPFGYDVMTPGVFLGLLSAFHEDRLEVPTARPQDREDKRVALKAYLRDPARQDAIRELEHFWRARRLREEMKLDPARIVEIDEILGVTLDYRLAESHALYWSVIGVEQGRGTRLNFDIHKLNTRRLEFFCLQKMFHRGRLAMARDARRGEPPLMQPDIRVAKVLFDAYVRDSQEFEKTKRKGPISQNFITGFVGFCRSAILRYHELGMDKEAKTFFDYLVKHYPDPMYENGMDGFLAEQFKADRELYDYRTSLARIQALILRGLQHYAYDEDDEAVRYLARARQVYDFYQKTIVSQRLRFTYTFGEIVQQVAHENGGQMSRDSYENMCRKVGIKPLAEGEPIPTLPSSQPAG
jgi:hypothetical protein